MDFSDDKLINYYINNFDADVEKEFAKLHSPNCSGLYRKWFNDKDFFCVDIIYEVDSNNAECGYWFGLCIGTYNGKVEHVDYLYQSDIIEELTEELIKRCEKEAEKIIVTERNLQI